MRCHKPHKTSALARSRKRNLRLLLSLLSCLSTTNHLVTDANWCNLPNIPNALVQPHVPYHTHPPHCIPPRHGLKLSGCFVLMVMCVMEVVVMCMMKVVTCDNGGGDV